MRDILLTLLICGALPFAIRRPWIGVMLWIWVSVMNPHRFTWGFAFDFPFAALIAGATIAGLFLTRDRVQLPLNATTVLLILLPLWMSVTYVFALEQAAGFERWTEVLKIFLFILICAALMQTREHINRLLWVIVLSVGFFGFKGGIFTIVTGGEYRVWGPPGGSFITDNNSISVALIMVIPLMYYLRSVSASKWVRWGLVAMMLLSGMAVLGSYSRGAMLAIVAMLGFLWLKSHKKVLLGGLMMLMLPFAISFMPEGWADRMKTIENYEQDASALGRINAWHAAVNIANDRPLVGGGFELYSLRTFSRYAPVPDDVHSAHSIYFQMLGEHGYVGLLLFLALGVVAWRTARRTIAAARDRPEFAWAADLAKAIQVSIIGFAVGGMFVNIAYWEIQYYEVLILMLTYRLVTQGLVQAPGSGKQTVAAKLLAPPVSQGALR